MAKKFWEKGLFEYFVYNLRDFSLRGKVDDYPYGGGAGMVLKVDVLAKSISSVQEAMGEESYVILLSPQGKKFEQRDAERLLEKRNLIFVCGHYEGFDERIRNYVDEQISIGDFITTGGETPSLVMTDVIIRAIPGSIKRESYEMETFSNKNVSNLDFSNYTRPYSFDGSEVPKVLRSGNHKEIKK
jgi:tRNA (guanine37-N1)-methyltransferase